MSIPVTCPECQAHFHVGDEFAGQPGRCPECAAVIQVPDPSAAPEERVDPHPFWTPRGVEAFEELPSRSPEPRPEERREPMRQHREDYADPSPRLCGLPVRASTRLPAAKWKAVASGLRNLMVAVTLIAVDELVGTSFLLVDGIKPGQENNFGPREGLIIGHGLIAGLCILMWMLGRIGCARVPYVPARRLALSGRGDRRAHGRDGVDWDGPVHWRLCHASARQHGRLRVGGHRGMCAAPRDVRVRRRQVMGVWSQIRMAEGLHDVTFGRTPRS